MAKKKIISTNETHPVIVEKQGKSKRLTSNEIQPQTFMTSGAIVPGAGPYIDTGNVEKFQKKTRKKKIVKRGKTAGSKSKA